MTSLQRQEYRRRYLAAGVAAALASATPAVAGTAVSPADLVEVRDISGLSLSPDFLTLVYRVEHAGIDSNSYVSRWYAVPAAGGVPRDLGGGGAPIFRDPGVSTDERPVWSPDGRFIYFRSLQNGAVQLWRAAVDGSGMRQVSDDDADILSFELDPDGVQLTYTVGATRAEVARAEEEEYRNGVLMDPSVDLAQAVFRGAIINGRAASQRLVGRWFSRDGLLWRAPLRKRRLDLVTGAVSDAGDETPPPAAKPSDESLLLAARFKDVEASVREAKGEQALSVAVGGAERTCIPDSCRHVHFAWIGWRPGTRQLVFASRGRRFDDTIRIWDVDSDAVRTVVSSDGLLDAERMFGGPCALSPDAAYCVASEAMQPPHVERIDLESGARTILHDPNAELRRRIDVQARPMSWSAAGHHFTGTLILPPQSSGPVPLFMTYYTCEGFLRGGLGDEWPLIPLAESGIAVLCVNRSPDSFSEARLDYQAALAGLSTIVDRLARDGLVDRRRIGMGGLSYGSEVTFWTMFNSGLLRAASVASPAMESSYYWFNGFRGRDNHERLMHWWKLGDPAATAGQWKLMSPALNAGRIRCALLLQLPEQEARLGTEFISRMSNSSTPFEAFVFPDEPHLKVQPAHKLAVYERNLDWFRYWLHGVVDPDPLKADQYRRWDAMAARAPETRAIDRAHSSTPTMPNSR